MLLGVAGTHLPHERRTAGIRPHPPSALAPRPPRPARSHHPYNSRHIDAARSQQLTGSHASWRHAQTSIPVGSGNMSQGVGGGLASTAAVLPRGRPAWWLLTLEMLCVCDDAAVDCCSEADATVGVHDTDEVSGLLPAWGPNFRRSIARPLSTIACRRCRRACRGRIACYKRFCSSVMWRVRASRSPLVRFPAGTWRRFALSVGFPPAGAPCCRP